MQDILDKHLNFWKGINTDPLIGQLGKKVWHKKPYPIKENDGVYDTHEITEVDIFPARMVGYKDKGIDGFYGDLILPFGYVYPEAWNEGFIGCHIYVSENSCTAKPKYKSYKEVLEHFSKDEILSSGWYKKAVEVMHYCIKATEGPVRQLHLRGLIDMLAAIVGETELCISVSDEDEYFQKVKELYTDLYIDIYKKLLQENKKWNNGYISSWKMFAPGSLLDYQIDASSLFSTKHYADTFLEFDDKIINQFEYSITHVHSCGLRHVDSLLKIKKLGAIEINLDRETNAFDFDEIIHYTNKIQENFKGVILVGELPDSDLEYLLSKVKVNALAIDRWIEE